MRKITQLAFASAVTLAMISCGGGSEGETTVSDSTKTEVKKDTTVSDAEMKEFKFFMVLANIPSPAHEVIEINKAGMKYDSKLPNPVANESKYSTAFKNCINYGVYTTDLAYIASFKDNADVMKYFVTTRKMADKAGAASVFDEIMKTEHFEDHIHNTDSLEIILDKVFVATEKFCETEHKLDVAVKVLLGSWIESQYLTLNAINGKAMDAKTEKLYNKVWENYLHLRNLLELLKEYDSHNELTELNTQLIAYADLYKDTHGASDFNKERIAKMNESIQLIRSKIIE
jgi:hypothetical protein